MKTYQNLEILKNISAMDIELNRRLINKVYEIFATDRNWENEETFNKVLEVTIESIDNIILYAEKIKESIEKLKMDKR